MKRKIELCRPCAEARREAGETLVRVIDGVDYKVQCRDCGRRRYGAIYEKESKIGRKKTDD